MVVTQVPLIASLSKCFRVCARIVTCSASFLIRISMCLHNRFTHIAESSSRRQGRRTSISASCYTSHDDDM